MLIKEGILIADEQKLNKKLKEIHSNNNYSLFKKVFIKLNNIIK